MQAPMDGHMDEVEATVLEASDHLAALGPVDHAQVQKALRDKPDLAMKIGEIIDTRAAQAGMSRSRRNQLRSMMMQTAFRLKHEGPGARIGGHAFWAHQKQVAQAPGATPPPPPPGTMPPPPPGAMQPVAYPAPVQVQSGHDRRFVMKAGGVMMGVGVVIFGVSALLVGGNDAFLLGLTVGAV